MTPQPQQEYIITFEELQFLKPDVSDGMYRSTKEKNQEITIFKVLSRPHTSIPTETDNELEELGNQDIDPAYFEVVANICDCGAREQIGRAHV